jgi:hypothetical protein
VRFERLTIQSGDHAFALPFHPRLTVIGGVGPLEREGLINELVGALGSGRSGVHLEVRSDAGTRYEIHRSGAGSDRVLELETGRDVTGQFTDPDGTVSVLQRAGLSPRQAKGVMRLGEADLTTRSEREDRILQLARIDQDRLWEVATKVKERAAEVATGAAEAGDPEDVAVYAEIERRHAIFEEAQAAHDKVRRVALLVGANAAVLAFLLAASARPLFAVPLLGLAAAMTAHSAQSWRRMTLAGREEEEALESAGSRSYLGFQVQRVNGLLADDHHRRRMMKAAEYHRAALAEWHLLASEVPVDWALENRKDIRQAAARLGAALGSRSPMGRTLRPVKSSAPELSQALQRRLDSLDHLGAGGESFPLFVDDAFRSVDAEARTSLLEHLVGASARQQIVLLTEDEEITAWARLEALSDHLAIIEPAEPDDRTGQSDEDEKRRAVRAVA